jgi:hypothetical protein
MAMKNCSVAGSIGRHSARSDTRIQAAHLRDFVQEFQRSISGHHGVRRALQVPVTCTVLDIVY